MNGNQLKHAALGEAFGTANGKLRKALLFEAIGRLGERDCYRCGVLIERIDDFSIEHKSAWMQAADKRSAFYDLGNIAYSHLSCNSAAASRFQSPVPLVERRREQNSRYFANPENRERHNMISRRVGNENVPRKRFGNVSHDQTESSKV
jgi:hypothetical protein